MTHWLALRPPTYQSAARAQQPRTYHAYPHMRTHVIGAAARITSEITEITLPHPPSSTLMRTHVIGAAARL
jgi:hypothetical protein